MKPVVRRDQASRDAWHAAFWYFEQAGLAVAERFTDALELALRHLAEHPRSGSLSTAEHVGIQGLRRWRVGQFPYAINYLDRPDHVDVWRVLHNRRDLATELDDEPEA